MFSSYMSSSSYYYCTETKKRGWTESIVARLFLLLLGTTTSSSTSYILAVLATFFIVISPAVTTIRLFIHYYNHIKRQHAIVAVHLCCTLPLSSYASSLPDFHLPHSSTTVRSQPGTSMLRSYSPPAIFSAPKSLLFFFISYFLSHCELFL
jgi:hypothetical protein